MSDDRYLILSVGQAGCRIGETVWHELCSEHGIDPLHGGAPTGATGKWEAFFSSVGQGEKRRYVPRGVFADLDPRGISEVKKRNDDLLNPANFISANEGSGNNFGVARYGTGTELVGRVLEAIDREFSKGGQPAGVILIHSLAGGTGSGLGALLLEKLKEKREGMPLVCFSVLPGGGLGGSEVVTEPYNAVFGIEALQRNADLTVFLDNQHLLGLAEKYWGVTRAGQAELNAIIAEIVCAFTGSLRFSGTSGPSGNLAVLAESLSANPGLRFAFGATVPLSCVNVTGKKEVTPASLTETLLTTDALSILEGRTAGGRELALSVFIRAAIEDQWQDGPRDSEGNGEDGSKKSPARIRISGRRSPGSHESLVLLANNSGIGSLVRSICASFDQLWGREAFANWYYEAGMRPDQIDAMRASVGRLCKAYANLA